ncbi:hypothetical protein [Nocardia amamiensis]|uniref:hypothetical protein n=1 Tax=Nocardia amamiensis TaxID=404578 RepID=UPI0033C09DC8
MTGFFARMAALATGDVAWVRLRPPQPFEGMWQGDPFAEVGVDEVFAGSSPVRVAEPAPVVRVPDAVPHDATSATHEEHLEGDRARTVRAPVVAENPADVPVPASRREHCLEGAPLPPIPTPAPESESDSLAALSPETSHPHPSDRPPTHDALRAPVPDVTELLREHLVPLLMARRVIEQSERVVVVERAADAPAPRRPLRPGVVEVSHTPVAPNSPHTAEPPPDSTPAPTVSLHIDRIVVDRGQAPQRSRPAPRPTPSTIDHDAYLARRRERP